MQHTCRVGSIQPNIQVLTGHFGSPILLRSLEIQIGRFDKLYLKTSTFWKNEQRFIPSFFVLNLHESHILGNPDPHPDPLILICFCVILYIDPVLVLHQQQFELLRTSALGSIRSLHARRVRSLFKNLSTRKKSVQEGFILPSWPPAGGPRAVEHDDAVAVPIGTHSIDLRTYEKFRDSSRA